MVLMVLWYVSQLVCSLVPCYNQEVWINKIPFYVHCSLQVPHIQGHHEVATSAALSLLPSNMVRPVGGMQLQARLLRLTCCSNYKTGVQTVIKWDSLTFHRRLKLPLDHPKPMLRLSWGRRTGSRQGACRNTHGRSINPKWPGKG